MATNIQVRSGQVEFGQGCCSTERDLMFDGLHGVIESSIFEVFKAITGRIGDSLKLIEEDVNQPEFFGIGESQDRFL
jgi:hypothetical protein